MDVDANSMIAEVSAQRNQAMDEVAMLRAAVKQLQAELMELKETEDER